MAPTAGHHQHLDILQCCPLLEAHRNAPADAQWLHQDLLSRSVRWVQETRLCFVFLALANLSKLTQPPNARADGSSAGDHDLYVENLPNSSLFINFFDHNVLYKRNVESSDFIKRTELRTRPSQVSGFFGFQLLQRHGKLLRPLLP